MLFFDLFRNLSHLLPSHRWRVEVVAPGTPNQREDWMDLDHLIFAQSLPETEYLVIGIWISKFDMEMEQVIFVCYVCYFVYDLFQKLKFNFYLIPGTTHPAHTYVCGS